MDNTAKSTKKNTTQKKCLNVKVNGQDDLTDAYKVESVKLLQRPDKIKYPSKKQIENVLNGLKYSISYLGSGVTLEGKDIALGSNYFMPSGTCDNETSSDECKGEKRYIYVRNIPTGIIPPLNVSFYSATGCNLTGLTEGRGIVPGLFEDVYDMNPVEIARAVTKNGNLGSNTCKKMTLPVGSSIYDKKKENKRWRLERRCTSGHHTMTETTNKRLNNVVKTNNPSIINARLPGPLQLRENFENTNSKKVLLNTFLLVCIMTLVLLKSRT